MSLGTFQYIRKLSFMVKIEKAEVLVTMKLWKYVISERAGW